MRRMDLYFLILATTSLVVGVALGIWMGIAHDFQFAPVHAHLNLLGWVSLSLFGLAYRAYPRLAESRLAMPHFVLACLGALCLPFGIALGISGFTIVVAIVGSFIWLAAVLLFLANLVRITLTQASSSAAFAPAE